MTIGDASSAVGLIAPFAAIDFGELAALGLNLDGRHSMSSRASCFGSYAERMSQPHLQSDRFDRPHLAHDYEPTIFTHAP
jgi:hypothetical protein